ncbi:MAG: glycosyltransferase family 87 protein [Microlunatus sp.]
MSSAEPMPASERSGLIGWWDAHRGGKTVILAWLVTRLAMFAILAVIDSANGGRPITGDVLYYHRKIVGLFEVGLPGTMMEYPTPVVWILTLPYGLGLGSQAGYVAAFVVFMLALDGVFTYAIWRSAGRRHDWAVDFWIAFILLMGPLSYGRFDIIPAVLAGGALLAARRHPWVAGALTGLGAAIKLWPALLIPVLLADKQRRKPTATGFVVVGFGLALISLIAGGTTRLFSPLTWQSGRGLQIESVWASPLMLVRMIHPHRWVVEISKFQAFEIFGPGVSLWQTASSVATVAGLVTLVALWIRAFRARGGVTPIAVALVVLATVAVMIITNKTLSPQYVLWLGGPVAALVLLRTQATTPELRRWIARIAVATLILAGLTQLVYPLLYDGYLNVRGPLRLVVATVVTTVRNLGLLGYTVVAVLLAWRTTSSSPATPNPAADAGR